MATEVDKEKSLEMIKEMLDLSAQSSEENYVKFFDRLVNTDDETLPVVGLENVSENIANFNDETTASILVVIASINFEKTTEEQDALCLDITKSYLAPRDSLVESVSEAFVNVLVELFARTGEQTNVTDLITNEKHKFIGHETYLLSSFIDLLDADDTDLDGDCLTVLGIWEDYILGSSELKVKIKNHIIGYVTQIAANPVNQKEEAELRKVQTAINLFRFVDESSFTDEDFRVLLASVNTKTNPASPPDIKKLTSIVYRALPLKEPIFDEELTESTSSLMQGYNPNVPDELIDMAGILGSVGHILYTRKGDTFLDLVLNKYPDGDSEALNEGLNRMFSRIKGAKNRKPVIQYYVSKAINEPAFLNKVGLIISNAKTYVSDYRFPQLRDNIITSCRNTKDVVTLDALLRILDVIKGPDFRGTNEIYSCFFNLLDVKDKDIKRTALIHIPEVYGITGPNGRKRRLDKNETELLGYLIDLIDYRKGYLINDITKVFDSMPYLLSAMTNRAKLKRKVGRYRSSIWPWQKKVYNKCKKYFDATQ